MLPHASVAVYVLTCVLVQLFVVTAPSAFVIFGVPQLSVAVALPAAGTPDGLHPSVESAGQNVNTGATLSVTLNVAVHVLVHPLESVTVKATVYEPHIESASTVTVELVEEPLIEAFPETDQLYEVIPAGPV